MVLVPTKMRLQKHDSTDYDENRESNDEATYTLSILLDGITDSNLHEEADIGRPVGKEANPHTVMNL